MLEVPQQVRGQVRIPRQAESLQNLSLVPPLVMFMISQIRAGKWGGLYLVLPDSSSIVG